MIHEVIPVKTGIQSFKMLHSAWIPACAGMTDLVLLQYPHMVSICLIN
jgi:hypothetical protein